MKRLKFTAAALTLITAISITACRDNPDPQSASVSASVSYDCDAQEATFVGSWSTAVAITLTWSGPAGSHTEGPISRTDLDGGETFVYEFSSDDYDHASIVVEASTGESASATIDIDCSSTTAATAALPAPDLFVYPRARVACHHSYFLDRLDDGSETLISGGLQPKAHVSWPNPTHPDWENHNPPQSYKIRFPTTANPDPTTVYTFSFEGDGTTDFTGGYNYMAIPPYGDFTASSPFSWNKSYTVEIKAIYDGRETDWLDTGVMITDDCDGGPPSQIALNQWMMERDRDRDMAAAQIGDSAAQRALQAAIAAARWLYGNILSGGENNFAATRVDTTTTTPKISDAEVLAAEFMADQEPDLTFIDKTTYGDIKDATPAAFTLWVYVNDVVWSSGTGGGTGGSIDLTAKTNPNGFTPITDEIPENTLIRPGEMIAMGIVAPSGNSFCVIIVADSSNGSVTGEGYQSVIEDDTKAGYGADCGMEATPSPQQAFKEMPQTPGTDPEPWHPVDVSTQEYAN